MLFAKAEAAPHVCLPAGKNSPGSDPLRVQLGSDPGQTHLTD